MNNTQTMFGRAPIQVTGRNGETEQLHIRQLSIDEYPAYGDLLARSREYDLAGFYCGRDAAWAQTLQPESILEIIEKGDELNADFFGRWTRINEARMKRTNPRLFAELERRSNAALDNLARNLSDRSSPISPSGAESPSPKQEPTASPS